MGIGKSFVIVLVGFLFSFVLVADTPRAAALFDEAAAAPVDEDLQKRVVVDAYDWLYGPANVTANRKATAGLQHPFSVVADNQSFEKVLAVFASSLDVNLDVNWKALEGAGIDRNTQVTVNLHDIPAYKILERVLRDLGGGTANLGWVLDSGIVTVTTRDDLNSARYQTVLVYDTRDLLALPDPQLSYDDKVRALAETIKSVIAPDSWRDAGGTIGSVREFRGQLIINQTSDNHRAVYRFLDQLRAAVGTAIRKKPGWPGAASPAIRTPYVSPAEADREGRQWGTPRAPDVPTLNMLGGRAYEPGK